MTPVTMMIIYLSIGAAFALYSVDRDTPTLAIIVLMIFLALMWPVFLLGSLVGRMLSN